MENTTIKTLFSATVALHLTVLRVLTSSVKQVEGLFVPLGKTRTPRPKIAPVRHKRFAASILETTVCVMSHDCFVSLKSLLALNIVFRVRVFHLIEICVVLTCKFGTSCGLSKLKAVSILIYSFGTSDCSL